jgi:reductive dehalogenase
MDLVAPTALDVVLLALGLALLAGFAAAAWTSLKEHEPRAAAIMFILALLAPVPLFLVGLFDFAAQPQVAAALLGLFAITGAYLLFPGGTPRLKDDDTPRVRIDERDIMFSRNLYEPGTARFEEYYAANPEKKPLDDAFRAQPGLLAEGTSAHHPLAFPAAEASFTTIEHLRPFVDGEPAAPPVEVDPATATKFVKQWTRKLGAVSVGVTELRDYHLYTTVGRGADYGKPVTLEHKYAVALTVEMDKVALDSAPLAPTAMESAQQYVASGVIAVQLAEFIRSIGYPARAHIDGNYRVVCPLVARDAGLGEIGRMGLLMTPELGPRVRLAVVTTDLPLVSDERRRDTTMIDFCAHCRKCADVCPSDAIPLGDRVEIGGVRRWQIDSEACFTLWCTIGTDCARCMKACPYSHPDNWMHNLVRRGVRASGRVRRLAIWGDDLFYGRRPPPRALPEWMQ